MKVEIDEMELSLLLVAIVVIALGFCMRGCSNELTEEQRALTAATNTIQMLKEK